MTNALSVTAPEGLPFIDTERDFDAPVSAVYAAHSDPDLFVQWIGPDGSATTLERFDHSTGGGYRFLSSGQAFNGVFHRVEPEHRVIQTFEWEGAPGQVSVETAEFIDLGDGRCRVRAHAVYPTLEARDQMITNGMERGMSDGYAKLDTLLASTDSEKEN